MAEDLHTVCLTGRCARDPELRHTPSGTAVLNIRLAYSSSRKDGDKWVEKSNYIDVVTFGNRAEALSSHLSKGSKIGVSGQLEWREWEATDGSKRQSYEVIVDKFTFLGDKGGGSGGGTSTGGGDTPAADRYDPAAGASSFSGDDDIPF